MWETQHKSTLLVPSASNIPFAKKSLMVARFSVCQLPKHNFFNFCLSSREPEELEHPIPSPTMNVVLCALPRGKAMANLIHPVCALYRKKLKGVAGGIQHEWINCIFLIWEGEKWVCAVHALKMVRKKIWDWLLMTGQRGRENGLLVSSYNFSDKYVHAYILCKGHMHVHTL